MKIIKQGQDFDHVCYCPFTGDVRWRSMSAQPGIYLSEDWTGTALDMLKLKKMPVSDRLTAVWRSPSWLTKKETQILDVELKKMLPVDLHIKDDRRWVLSKAVQINGKAVVLNKFIEVLSGF